jgi:hypothetical protein
MIALLPDGCAETLALGDAVVALAGKTGPTRAEPARWRPAGDSRWMAAHSAAPARTLLTVSHAPESGAQAWRIRIEGMLDQPARISRWVVHLTACATTAPYYLDRNLRWRPLAASDAIPEFTPLAIAWPGPGGAYRLTSVRGCCAAEVNWQAGRLELCVVLDAAALHPRWYLTGGPRSEAAPEQPAGCLTTIELLLLTGDVDPTEPGAVAARYPAGCEAAFTLTDHCDFDTSDRLARFLSGRPGRRGWCGRDLHFTKGVFTLPSRPADRSPAASLHDPDYRRLVDSLHADGSEIAPHGLNESGDLDQATFRSALDDIVRAFGPRTWIDHGLSQRYGYTTGGADPAGYDLCAILRAAGFSAVWAYHDVIGEPAVSLDLFSPAGSAHHRGRLALHHAARGAYAVAAHYARSQIRDVTHRTAIGEYLAHAISTVRGIYLEARGERPVTDRIARVTRRLARAPAELRRAAGLQQPEPYDRRDLAAFAPTVYPESASPARDADPHGLCLFASQEVVHTADAYTDAALERLLQGRGLHIGHCYLLNRLPYLAGTFTTDGKDLDGAWVAFLDALTAVVAEGRLWNPTMGALAEWVRRFHLTSVVPLHDAAVRVETRSPVDLSDFTLLLPASTDVTGIRWNGEVPVGTRRWGDWLAVWGLVPAHARVTVQWCSSQREPLFRSQAHP